MSGLEPPARAGRAGWAGWAERAGGWLTEEALTALLILLAVDLFLLPVLGPNVGEVAFRILFTVLLFTGLAAVASRGIAFAVVALLVFGAAVLEWLAPHTGEPRTPAMAAVVSLAALALMTLLLLFRTLSPGPITRHRIEGAVAVYLLMAMTFAIAFELAELVHPGSLRFGEGGPEDMRRAIGYFSTVTLTTVGFGDVTPVSPLARRLAMLEGVIGQLYPAIIIGWMVSSLKRRED